MQTFSTEKLHQELASIGVVPEKVSKLELWARLVADSRAWMYVNHEPWAFKVLKSCEGVHDLGVSLFSLQSELWNLSMRSVICVHEKIKITDNVFLIAIFLLPAYTGLFMCQGPLRYVCGGVLMWLYTFWRILLKRSKHVLVFKDALANTGQPCGHLAARAGENRIKFSLYWHMQTPDTNHFTSNNIALYDVLLFFYNEHRKYTSWFP